MSAPPRACILSPDGPELSEAEAAFLRQYQPFGMILMGRSCVEPEQIRSLVDHIWAALSRPCLVFIDQEGGRVARLKPPAWPEFPPLATYGALFADDEETGREAAFLGHRLMAAELAPLGIHADCAPVLDLRLAGASRVIGDRSAGADPNIVAAIGRAALDGLASGGVAGVIKHIPGHGRALSDSHEHLPLVDAGMSVLAEDFAPFKALNQAPMAMTAHIVYAAIDRTNPATQSHRVISEVIRSRIGFDGLLMSDDISMKALTGSMASRVARSLEAGCDLVLHCAGSEGDPDFRVMREIADAACPLSGAAHERAMAAMNATTAAPDDFDAESARDRFAGLIASVT